MRILLDECLPRRLKRGLVGHDVQTVPEAGWASKQNGELLALAEHRFDVFVTADRNLSFQRDMGRFKMAVVVLVARGNKESDLRAAAERILGRPIAAPNLYGPLSSVGARFDELTGRWALTDVDTLSEGLD